MILKIVNYIWLPVILIFFLLFIVGSVNCQQITMTLEESIEAAMKNNLGLKTAEEKVKSAEQKVNEARSAMLPSASVTGSYTYLGKTDTSSFSSLLGGGIGGFGAPAKIDQGSFGGMTGLPFTIKIPKDNYNVGLAVRQPLFTWGKIFNAYKQSKLALEAEKQALEGIRQQVIFDTTKAFYGVLLADQLVKVTEMAVEQVQAHVKVAQDLLDAGMATDFDLLRAKVQLANVRSQLIKMQNMSKLAKDGFKNTIGLSLDADVNLKGEITYKPLEVDLDSLLKIAMDNRPELKQLEIQEQIGEKIVSLAKAGNKPNLAFVYNYAYKSNADTIKDVFSQDKYKWNNSWNLSFALSVPLFDGFATRAKVKQAKSALNQIKIGKEQLINGIILDVRSSYMSFQEAKELLKVQDETVQQAEESLRIANLRYKNGMITSVELMDAELAFTQAQTNYSNALNDYVIAIARLEKATASKLDQRFGGK
ncbi:MAG: TolC family protein [Candidatus Poribacteria bacterium]